MTTLGGHLHRYKVDGPNDMIDGRYHIPHPKISGYVMLVIASTGMGWDHVSVSLWDCRGKNPKAVERCPTWDDMCYLKNLFFNKDETVIQYHPPEASYVNNHKYCLHLWRSQEIEIPVPERILVGI
jgi:hypothetical protein